MVTVVVLSFLRFLPSVSIAHRRLQQSHCSSIFHRVLLLIYALALFAGPFVHKKKSPQIYTRMHSGRFELTKLTYTRLDDNLIRHRGDRLGHIVVCCCFLTLTLVKHLESVVTQGAGALGRSEKPSEIKIRQRNTTLSRLKTHDTEKGAQVKGSNVQSELTWPRVSTQLQTGKEPCHSENIPDEKCYLAIVACVIRHFALLR